MSLTVDEFRAYKKFEYFVIKHLQSLTGQIEDCILDEFINCFREVAATAKYTGDLIQSKYWYITPGDMMLKEFRVAVKHTAIAQFVDAAL
jgi:hypothetical protein